MSRITHLAGVAGLALAGFLTVPGVTRADNNSVPLDLSFLPPDYAPRNVCGTKPKEKPDVHFGEDGHLELTDPDRVLFLKRDIARLKRADAARYFDFIETLIARRATLDGDYSAADAMFDRVRLHLRAGRLDALADLGLVAALAKDIEALTNEQILTLAQYHRTGIGVAPDLDKARTLMLEAAYDGHARALLELVRLNRVGTPVAGWDAPLDLTVTMAFGALLGGMNEGVCDRAEIIAQEFLKGELVRADPETALAWRRFAADMGGADAAWRVVEYHLSAPGDRKDDAELRRYLQRSIELGHIPGAVDRTRVLASGAVAAEELRAMLGHNELQDGRPSDPFLPLLDLDVIVNGRDADEDGLYLDHLREVVQYPGAPGLMFLWLAGEVSVKEGRWAAEQEIVALLEEAVRRGEARAMQALADRLIRYRDDPVRLNRAENLLIEASSVHGLESAKHGLDALYRCQVTDAPRLAEAEHWATAYRATGHGAVPITATDLIALDPFRDPEVIARIQTQALQGRSTVMARHITRLVSDGGVVPDALGYWADRLDGSKQGLEAFAELEFELSTSPAQRAQAVEFFRRVYLNNGVTTALDLAIALIEDHGRDPEIAAEVIDLLDRASRRGEGAAIRLLARVQAGERTAADVFAEYAEEIEARGDFLAMMFALPFVGDDKAADYFDRAVSLMNCGTKDADELGDAHAIRGDGAMSYHWRRVGLHFEGGHVLAKLRLSNPQMAMFGTGPAPAAADVAARAVEDGDRLAHRRAFWLASNPDLRSYDPQAAAAILAKAFTTGLDGDWAIGAWHRAGPAIREVVADKHDVRAISAAAAEHGNSSVRFDHAMLLRNRARGPADLAVSAQWLLRAAEAGHTDAMVELGFALGFGLGVDRDDTAALVWLDRALSANNNRAGAMAALIRSRAAP